MATGDYSKTNIQGLSEATKMPWLPIALCCCIMIFDGFDVLVMAYTAPAVARDWNIAPVSLGLLFSSGLFGMMLGAMFLSPIADTYGRRAIILSCLTLISVSMVASALTGSLLELSICRFLTGLGIGGLLVGGNTAAAEYAPPKRRELAISIVTTGYPFGAVLGGVIAIELMEHFDWRSVFLFGGLASTIFIPIVWLFLPESIAFLVSKRPPNALARVNAALKQLKRQPVAELPVMQVQQAKAGLLDVFKADLRGDTFAMCAAYFLMMLSLYFALSWIPKNLVDLGLSQAAGISISVVINVAGIVGGLSIGFITRFIELRKVAVTFMVLTWATLSIFGALPADQTLLTLAAIAYGFFVFGAFVSLYTIVAEVFPTHVRATGTGLALGVGRIGAVVGPVVAGFLIAEGWERWAYYLVLALPCLIAGYVGTRVSRRMSK